jgi:hypothetical protein
VIDESCKVAIRDELTEWGGKQQQLILRICLEFRHVQPPVLGQQYAKDSPRFGGI